MKLVLYSGGQTRQNYALHRSLVGLCENKKPLRLTYIPFCADNATPFFSRIIRRYRSFGVQQFYTLAVDEPFTAAELKLALQSDIVYLAGGNTFYFLETLRRSGLMNPLRQFVRQGGVLAGLSAGALILTPNIRLAGIPTFEADENDIGLHDLNALGVAPFEFSPHYSSTKRRDRSLLAYSLKTAYPIYACPDGGGIVINGEQWSAYGRITVFHRGRKFNLIP